MKISRLRRVPLPVWVLGGLSFAVLLYSVAGMRHYFKTELPPKIQWLDYEAGMNLATKEKRPLLLYFHASWCEPCKRMEQTAFQDQAVADWINNKTSPVIVDVDKDTEVAGQRLTDKFGVKAYPMLIILDSSGRESGRKVGYKSAEELLPWLKETGKSE